MNKTTKLAVLLTLLSSSLVCPSAQAAVTPLGLAIAAPVQLPPQSFTVAGVRASALWGDHREVYGFDFGGIGNISDNRFVGLGVSGGFNWNRGESTILLLQAAGGANINVNKARIYGVQVAGLVNSNVAESSLVGLQVALVNLSTFTNIYGIQVGLYNRAKEVYGLQVGVFNIADNLHGLQLGLLNFNTRGLFSIAPFLNIGF